MSDWPFFIDCLFEFSARSADRRDAGDTSVLAEEINLDSLPEYSGEATIEINDNVPDFEEYEIEEAQTSYESYSELDALGRCGKAEASVSLDTMPTKKRTSISSVKPSGWENEKYDFVSL